MLFKICKKAIGKLSYKYPDDIDDGVSTAMEKCLRYWKNYDDTISLNVFAYFTSMVRNAYAESFNKLRGGIKQSDIVSLSDDFSNIF
jgi:hypothetical protein